nr:hypothetical protein [Tanacetum cinerariifolium]
MVNLEFYDKHNMVPFLKKPQGSEAFLNASHIRYALTENLTIYVSLINQFWHTTSARTLGNEEIKLNATVDGQDKTITKASVRRHLNLADADGISTLPTTEIFEQLALMSNMKRESRGFSRVETTLFPTMLVNEQLSQGEGLTSPVGTQHTPTVIETSPQLQNISNTYRKTRTRTRRRGIRIPQSNVPLSVTDEAITKDIHDGLERATTTASSLEVEQEGSGNLSKTQTKATPFGPSSPRTSSEGCLGCHVTMGGSPVQARPERLSNLPNEPPLEESNTSQNEEGSMQLLELMNIYTKLSDKDEEASLDKVDSPKQGRMIEEIDEDENVNLVKSSKQWEAHETVGHRMESNDTKVVDFSTAKHWQYTFEEIKMLFDKNIESTRKFVPMESEGQIAYSKAKEGSLKEGKSLKSPAEEELGQEHQKKEKVKESLLQERLQQMMVIIPEQGIHVEALQTKEDLVKLWSLVKERFDSSDPIEDKEIALWVELKILFEPDEDDELWKFESFELIWRLYDWCGVHHISTRDGQDIFMLVEKEYPLSRGALLMMLVQKLQVDKHNKMAEELLRKIFMQAKRPRK